MMELTVMPIQLVIYSNRYLNIEQMHLASLEYEYMIWTITAHQININDEHAAEFIFQ